MIKQIHVGVDKEVPEACLLKKCCLNSWPLLVVILKAHVKHHVVKSSKIFDLVYRVIRSYQFFFAFFLQGV